MKKKFRKIMAFALSAAMVVTAVPAIGRTAEASSPQEHIDLTRQVAADGMVLMENDGALPLAQGEKVAMFGRAMIDYVRGGGGSGATVVDYTRNILQGMQIKADEGKISLYQPLVDFYTEQVTTNGITNDANITVSDELMDDAAANADTAIVTIGRYSSEGSDRSASKGDYYLSDAETELLTRVAAKFKKTVVVLNVGAVLDTSWIKSIPGIDSVLMAWQAGMEGGLATADVLVGDVNPSGKFVDTFAKSYDDYPSSDTFYESSAYVNYEEDIFVGYRYFETFDPNYERVNYEFGYGLSYTTFDISDVTVAAEGDDIVATAKVTNTGDVAGKEVVQVYFSAPQGKLGKPAKELAAFDKTDLLAPGESQTLTMSFPIDDMSSYDDTGKVQKSAYILEAGDYNIYVGNSIKDAGENGIRYTYNVAEDAVTEQLSEQCAPIQLERRLLADGTWEVLEAPAEMDPHYTVAAEGVTRVESENFLNSSGNLHIESYYDTNLEQQKCLAYLNAAGRYMEYELTAEKAGKYSVIMSMANGNAALSNCFKVYVNGEYQPGIVFNAQQTGDGSGASEWYNFIECEPFYINLEEGTNLVRFVANGNNPNYDYMLIKRVGEQEEYYKKAVAAEGQTKIEGEEFDESGMTTSNNAVRIERFNNNTEACLAYMNYVGNYVSYYLKVAEAGEYNITLNVANGRAGFTFDPGITVNGTAYPATITAVQTGDGDGASQWYNFEDLEPVTVTLPAGNVVLTLTCKEANKYPNIDYITIEKKETVQAAARAVRAAAQTTSGKIMLVDVYNSPDLMDDFLAQLTDEQLANLLQGQPNTGVANTGGMGNLMEYGIPNAMTADGPQGIRIGTTCTAWPVSTLLACTWDVDLVEEVGKAAAIEAHNNGIDIWLAPGMNIHRDPLCGRNFEYYSEDPLIAGKMAAAITKGCQSEGVSITLKHFAANNKETNRNSSDSRMSERALREIYLKGFEIAVKEAQPWSIMTSYNYINGTETSENKELLTNIARGEWGYEGIFMTDWGNNSNHAREVLAGNDVKMPSGSPSTILAAKEKGIVTREDMEACAARLMKMIMKVNVFNDKILDPPATEIGDDTYFKAAENIIWSQTARAETTSDTDGGRNLGYCDAGAWTEYRIKVAKSGQYDLSARTASNAGAGAFDVVVDGEVIASFDPVYTGGWQNWATLDAQSVHLEEGSHTLRLEFTESGSNVNWLRFTLTNAVNGAIKDSLKALHDAWASEDLSVYSKESVAALTEALEAAEAVLSDTSATQKEITDATVALVNAIGNLEYGVQKVHLETAIEFAEKLLELENNYEDTKALKAALAEGKIVLANADATQEEADNATYAILDELAKLAKKADVASLESLIEAAEGLLSDKYTSDSVEALKEAIDNAKEVLEDPNRADSAIADAYREIIDAVIGLQMRGNKAALAAMIAKAEKVLAAKDSYVAASIEGIEEELAAAVVVYNDADALQDEINEAVKALTLEVADARLLGDVDSDGAVTTADSAAVLRSAAELDTLSAEAALSADVNGDGAADTNDAVLILQFAAEKIAAF